MIFFLKFSSQDFEGVRFQLRLVPGIITMGYAAVALLGSEWLPDRMISLFTNDPQILDQGTIGLKIMALALMVMPIPLLIAAYYQALGQKLWSLLLNALTMVAFIPCLAILPSMIGLNGVW